MRVAVIGAGILGASTAYHLMREGADVVVVDAAHEGKATMAGAGIVCPWATRNTEPDFYRLYASGGAYYSDLVRDMAERGEHSTGYKQTGALVISEDPAELVEVEKRVRERISGVAIAGEAIRLSGRDVQGLFPPLKENLEALYITGGARVEARTLAAALLRIVTSGGGKVHQGLAVLHLEGQRAVCRAPDGHVIDADEIVATAGAWAPSLLGPVGVSPPIEPQKGQILHLRLPGIDTSAWPVVLPQNGYYMLAFDDSRVVVGATRETGAGFDYRVTAGGVAEVLQFGLTLAPGLHGATLFETRIGFRPAGTGAAPFFSRVPGIDNLVVGNGLGTGGLTMGPFGGKLLADIALGKKPQLDLAPYTIYT